MSNFNERIMVELATELPKFLDTLTGNELNELQKIDFRLIAKIYQAGAVFMIDAGSKIAREEKAKACQTINHQRK